MTRMLVLAGLTVVQLAAALAPCGTVAPAAPVGYTTTPAGVTCDTPLCQGLVGAGVGAAGLAAIGGIAAAAAHHKKPAAAPVTPAPVVTAAPVIFNREEVTTTAAPSSSGGWLLPLLIGLLLLCCLLGLIGYLCMKPKQKRDTKVKKTKVAAPAESAPLMEPVSLYAPMGHWEQPKQIVPVTTAQTSMVPQITTAQVPVTTAQTSMVPQITTAQVAMAAPTYTETFAPTYAVQAPTYVEPAVVSRGIVAPTYAMAAPAYVETAVAPTSAYAISATPTIAAATYVTAPTAVVGAGGYATGASYTAPTAVVGTGYGVTGALPSGTIY